MQYREGVFIGFNLAIEMLVISGQRYRPSPKLAICSFQSRNRDACHFRSGECVLSCLAGFPFQSRNRDACHFRTGWRSTTDMVRSVSISQSRCLSFQVQELVAGVRLCLMFQSRNRDACHFRSHLGPSAKRVLSFNLAIEMLVISGSGHRLTRTQSHGFNLAIEMLVISGERKPSTESLFICFNLAIEMLVISGFQLKIVDAGYESFNLAIEMLVISGGQNSASTTAHKATFQSRNRDACHFRARGVDDVAKP